MAWSRRRRRTAWGNGHRTTMQSTEGQSMAFGPTSNGQHGGVEELPDVRACSRLSSSERYESTRPSRIHRDSKHRELYNHCCMRLTAHVTVTALHVFRRTTDLTPVDGCEEVPQLSRHSKFRTCFQCTLSHRQSTLECAQMKGQS